MPKLTIVAHIHAGPGKIDLVKAELERIIPPTRAEAGCLQYDMHRDNEDSAHFMFFEIWESRDLWLEHMKSGHIEEHRVVMRGNADVTLHEMTHLA